MGIREVQVGPTVSGSGSLVLCGGGLGSLVLAQFSEK